MDKIPISYEEIVRRAGAPVVAVVFGVGHFQGLAVMRGLGRMGVPVYAIGEPKSVGFHSRYARECLVSPDPHRDSEGLMCLLLALGRRLKSEGKRTVLFPTRDSVVELIAKEQGVLSQYFICHTPDYDVISRCSDKEAQIQAARETGVPIPCTYADHELPRLDEDLAKGRLAFPVVLKPKKELPSDLKKKFRAVVIESRAQLDGLVRTVNREGIRFLVQEIIPGADDQLYTFGSCLSRTGDIKACFTGRKLRQFPPRFGICRVGESKQVEPIIHDGTKLLRALRFFGISQVEFKFDARDSQYKLMEVNPRPWVWIGLPIGLSINIPYAHFCDALGVDTPLQTMPPKRGLYISLYDDLCWSLKARDGRPWAHLFKGYDVIVDPYYSPDDRMPGVVYYTRCAGMLMQTGFNRIVKALRLRR